MPENSRKQVVLAETRAVESALTPTRDELRQQVLKTFRTKLTPYLSKLAKQSDAIARQFIPSTQEAVPYGLTNPFEEGKDNRGIYGLERIYEDRALITPYFECAAYCRYCFKKTRTLAGEPKRMSDDDLARALSYIASDERISTVLITGGDPFLDENLLCKTIEGAVAIPHVSKIRIGTRNILFDPGKITDSLVDRLSQYQQINYSDVRRSKNISVALSINHPDELAPEVVRAVEKFLKKGIVVRAQSVLLKGINDSAKTMAALLDTFLSVGLVPYYLYHCYPVIGTKHLRTSVQKGLDILKELREFSGALDFSNYVYASQIGKHRLSPDLVLDYRMIEGKRYIRSKTPYKAERFFEFADKKKLPPLHEISSDGYIISHYLDGEDD